MGPRVREPSGASPPSSAAHKRGYALSARCCSAVLLAEDGVDLHSLRYSFATHLLRAGVPIQTVQRLVRWKTVDVLLGGYAQTFPADERAAVERLPYFAA
jgi:integrase